MPVSKLIADSFDHACSITILFIIPLGEFIHYMVARTGLQYKYEHSDQFKLISTDLCFKRRLYEVEN